MFSLKGWSFFGSFEGLHGGPLPEKDFVFFSFIGIVSRDGFGS
jgi:hypothetical protein